MSFTSIEFIFLFIPLILAGYYLIKGELRNIFLVIVSLIFYATGEPIMIWFLIASILVNYIFGLLLSREWKLKYVRTIFLIMILAWNIGSLFYFKYLTNFLETYKNLIDNDYLVPQILLPLGISFFTFRSISYCMDVYWKTVPVEKNPLHVALYISFFPQVSMGPITKYADFSVQYNNRKFDIEEFGLGAKRIIIGLFKKLVLSNTIGAFVDIVFSLTGSERTIALAWMGIWGYLIQLYFDFSGYSDMAIGLGKMLGFNTPENFDYPYCSKSVVEFWNRWHITLGAWLKDYLYMPIFRAAQSKRMTIQRCNILALFGVWLIVGIWHGAGLKFIVYGMYYFAFIILERTIDEYKKKKRKKLKIKKQPDTKRKLFAKYCYFAVVIVFGQLLFRSDNFQSYGNYVLSMFGQTGNQIVNTETIFYLKSYILNFVLGTILCFPLLKNLEVKLRSNITISRFLTCISPVIYLIILVIAVAYAFTSTYQSFIYFQF